MTGPISAFRATVAFLFVAVLALSLTGCPSKESGNSASSSSTAKKLDGVYHQAANGPMTLTIKDGKATMTIGTESKTLDYKVEGNKLTILDPKEGNADFVINDDGTLNSQLGSFTKSAT